MTAARLAKMIDWLTDLKNDSSTESDANRADWQEMLQEVIDELQQRAVTQVKEVMK